MLRIAEFIRHTFNFVNYARNLKAEILGYAAVKTILHGNVLPSFKLSKTYKSLLLCELKKNPYLILELILLVSVQFQAYKKHLLY